MPSDTRRTRVGGGSPSNSNPRPRQKVSPKNFAGGGSRERPIVDPVREPLIVLDEELRVLVASRSFYRAFEATPQQTEGRPLYELGSGEWNIPALRKLLEDIIPHHTTIEEFEVEHDFPT